MKIYSELILPHAEIVGDYEMNGKILILPIKGQGKANITLGKYISSANQFQRYVIIIIL